MAASLQKRASWAGKPCSLAPVPCKPRWPSVLASSPGMCSGPHSGSRIPRWSRQTSPCPFQRSSRYTEHRCFAVVCALQKTLGYPEGLQCTSMSLAPELGTMPEQSGVLNIWMGTPKWNKWTQKTLTANLKLSAGHVPAWTSLPQRCRLHQHAGCFPRKHAATVL